MTLVFATHNTHKSKELIQLLPKKFKLYSLSDIGCVNEIPETGDTLAKNAKIKADFVKYKFGLDCFADDSGLEVEALQGAPGVHSARYAGNQRDHSANIQKIWDQLKGQKNTRACFRTVIFAHVNKKSFQLEGRINGHLIFEKRGNKGFGYDPIFIPEGFNQTFAELGDEIKNKISHRAIATKAFLKTLEQI